MIQNILTFCVKNDLTFVEGSIPSGKLVANDINRNSIYLITPYDESIVKANFQTNLQSDTPTSVLGILVNGKISIDEIVDTTASYYNLVKDWNIYEFKVPSTTLSFISRNRTGKIGINFSIEQRLVPTIKDSYGEYQGEILAQDQALTESGYYINKTIEFELDTGEDVFIYNLNDILVLTKRESPLEDIQVKIRAYSNRGSTPTTLYSVDPSLLNDNFETINPGLTQQIVQQVNDNTGDIVLLFQNIGVNNATLVDLENRVSVAEQDIDYAENDITNLQGRMATAESDIDKIENGTTIVGKALRDSLGNVIKDSYVSAVYPVYNDTMDKLYIETYGVGDILLANNEVILPKATTSKDGLMSKEDKTKLDNINIDVSNKLDKVWSNVVSQTMLNLTDEFVLNRGNQVYKTTLSTLLGSLIPTDIFIVVNELPEEGQANKIYLVPKEGEGTQNGFDEYIWIDEDWEKLGSIDIDLSNYYTKTEVDALKVDKNANITGATKTKITYDSKGLVTAGADLGESDIPPLAISKITGLQTALDDLDATIGNIDSILDSILGV